MTNLILCLFLLTYSSLFPSKANQKKGRPPAPRTQLANQKALLALKQVLKNYHFKSIQIKVEQEIFLFAIETSVTSQGVLSLKKGKFHLQLYGSPASIMIFDGKFLWYQADTSENIVFCLKEHPQIQILRGLFFEESFFNTFSIQDIQESVQKKPRVQFSPVAKKPH